MINELKRILINHEKLLSMVNSKILPIKEVLVSDVIQMREILETSTHKKGGERNEHS
jgi:hypothetical protein